MATRTGLPRAGAAMLSAILSDSAGHVSRVACGCGPQARYHDQRPKRLLTALGPRRFERAYYLCSDCQRGRSTRDRELDVEGTAYSSAVRRMMALVGAENSFDQGREQLDLLAGTEVAAKAVERHAEAIGADIAAREDQEICRATQLELPEVLAPAAPVFYIEMDGSGLPVVKAETEGRHVKIEGQPAYTREAKLGRVSPKPPPTAMRDLSTDEGSTTYTAAIETADEFGVRLYTEAWRRGWSRAQKKVVLDDGAV